MSNSKKCFCTNTTNGIDNCTFSGDGCCGPMTDADDKLLVKLFESLQDVPGLTLNNHYKQKWKRLILHFTLDIRKSLVDLLLAERFK